MDSNQDFSSVGQYTWSFFALSKKQNDLFSLFVSFKNRGRERGRDGEMQRDRQSERGYRHIP